MDFLNFWKRCERSMDPISRNDLIIANSHVVKWNNSLSYEIIQIFDIFGWNPECKLLMPQFGAISMDRLYSLFWF